MKPSQPALTQEGAIGDLVRAAAGGDEGAWNRLVDRFAGLIWSIARAHGLSAPDAGDVSQTTWLRLAEHLGRLRKPESVGAWLASTARNECLRTIRHARRHVPAGDDEEDVLDSSALSPPARVLRAERDSALWRAFNELSERCRTLLRVVVADPRPSYEEVGSALGIPIGSIGPTRARCLERLRHHLESAGISRETDDSYE